MKPLCYHVGVLFLNAVLAIDDNGSLLRGSSHPRCKELPSFDSSVKPETVISFLTMGDVPYTLEQRYCMNHQLRNVNLTDDNGPAFMIHVGDIKDGDRDYPCDFNAYNDIAQILAHPNNALHYDTRDVFFVPGDNEWTDCEYWDHSWKLWMDHFGPSNEFGFGTLSDPKVTVTRQTTVERLPGVDRSENFAFFVNKVLFVGLNIVGGDPMGDESVRLNQNLDWVRQKLKHYSRLGMVAAFFFGHAPIKPKDVRRRKFGDGFFDLLVNQYPNLPVMYVHGDWHDYCYSYPDSDNPNLVDLEVDAGINAPPLLVSLLRNPKDDTYIITTDRRGGLYEPEGNCPLIKDMTWNPPYRPSNPNLKEYEFISNQPQVKLDVCQGDCGKDADCKGNLRCFDRDYDESVPGCWGSTRKGKDYCYNPDWNATVPTPSPTLKSTLKPTTAPPPSSSVSASGDITEKPSSPTNVFNLTWVTKNPKFRLAVCEADCDEDDDCQDGLLCFKGKKDVPVPGCNGVRRDKADYCYDPRIKQPLRFVSTKPRKPLGVCRGHCSSDDQCAEDLHCFVRVGLEPVPGCTGRGRRDTGYCTPRKVASQGDPKNKTSRPTPTPTSVPSNAPTPVPIEPVAPNAFNLTWVKKNPSFTLGECEADCDSHNDCMGSLLCFKGKQNMPVPGCEGVRRHKADYCYDPEKHNKPTRSPTNAPIPTPTNQATRRPTEKPTRPGTTGILGELTWVQKNPSGTLGVCEADCDNDDECSGALLCFKGKPGVPVPGCSGVRRSKADYCYDPDSFPPLTFVSDKPKYRLDACQGACNNNNQCKSGLRCSKRGKGLEPIPGCSGLGKPNTNYCFKPTVNITSTKEKNTPQPSPAPARSGLGLRPPKKLVRVGNRGKPKSAYPLGECESDCDYNSDCQKGLICFHRKAFQPVPGCAGNDHRGRDYCINTTATG